MSDPGRTIIGLALAGALSGAAPSASAQFVKTSDRLDYQRYSTLRALAEYVDDGAEFTLEEAREAVGNSRNARERNLMRALRNFQQQARRFHNRMDEYEIRPWRVDNDLNRLRTAARNVNTQLRRVPAMSRTFQDWDMVIQDINDMTRVVAGSNVTLRRPTSRWDTRTGDHHQGEWPAYGDDSLRGQRLDDFRRLARELDVAARQAHTRARNQRADNSDYGAQLLVDLDHFARQAAQVRTRSDSGDVRPRDIGPLVTHLLEDARRADASMRRARVYSTVWNEWADVIRKLEEMTPLLRNRTGDDRRGYDRAGDDRFGDDTLRGQRLDDFRRLSRELDVAAREAYNRARNQRADYTGAGVQLLRDLEHFAQQAAQVRAQADGREVRPRDINPIVTHLLDDARRADTSMRSARVYSTVWNEWADVIRKLEQMTPLVR